MRILAKSSIPPILVVFAASSALFPQTPEKPQNEASGLDARQIVALSIVATERNWQARDHYAYMERDEDRRMDSKGDVKSEDDEVSKTTLVNGTPFEQL